MAAQTQSIIYFRHDFPFDQYTEIISKLALAKTIRASDKKILEAMMSLAQLVPDLEDENGSGVAWSSVIEDIKDSVNPDFKNGRTLAMSRTTSYRRLKEYKDINLLESASVAVESLRLAGSNLTELLNKKGELQLPKNTDILKMRTPSIQKDRVAKKVAVQNTKGYRQRSDERQLALMDAEDMTFIKGDKLDKVGSMKQADHLFDRCTRASKKITAKTLPNKIAPPKRFYKGLEDKTGGSKRIAKSLDVITTCFDDSEIMGPGDKKLKDLIYSMLVRHGKFRDDNPRKGLINSFTFDTAEIARLFDKKHGGGSQSGIYNTIVRIGSNRFKATPNDQAAIDFMTELGLNFDGKLSIGDQLEFFWWTVLNTKIDSDVSEGDEGYYRYVTIAVYPPYFEQLAAHIDDEFIELYERNMDLLKLNDDGFVWELNSYLRTFLVAPGRQYSPNSLKTFLTRRFPSLDPLEADSDDIAQKIEANLMKSVHEFVGYTIRTEQILLYVDNPRQNSRRIMQADRAIALCGDFLVQIVETSGKKRLNNLEYEITVHFLTDDEVHYCKEHNATLEKFRHVLERIYSGKSKSGDGDYLQLFASPTFLKWTQNVLSKRTFQEKGPVTIDAAAS